MTQGNNSLKITIKNFQSIEDMELEFPVGINCIVGASNSGKTAVFRALKTLVLNTSGSNRFIKNGADKATVSLSYNGNLVVWERTEKEITYYINGVAKYKAGATNLQKLLPEHGFIIDDKGNFLNLEGEFDVLFPYQYNSVELFKLFENIFCVSDSTKILKAMKEDEDSCKSNIKDFTNEINRINNKLKAIEELDVENNVATLSKCKESLKNWYSDQEILKKDTDNILNIAKNMQKLKHIPEHIELQTDTLEDRKEFVEDKNTLEKLRRLQEVVNEIELHATLDENMLHERIELQEDIKTVETIYKLDKLIKVGDTPTVSDNFDERSTLSKDLESILQLKGQMSQVNQKLKELNALKNGLKDELDKIDICPLCGQEINGIRV